MPCAHNHGYPELNLGSNAAKWQKNLTQSRLDQFVEGRFADINLSAVLYDARVDDAEHVQLAVWSAPERTKPLFDEAMKQKFKPAKKGDSFGPSYWAKYPRVQFEFDPGCEAMIFEKDGTPLQGITGGGGGDRRVEYIIPRDAVKAGKHEFVIEMSCNGMFGIPWNGDIIMPPDMNRYFTLSTADITVPNAEAWALRNDFDTLKQLSQTLPGNSVLQNAALTAANEILNIFDRRDASTIGKARKVAERVFGQGWEGKGAGIYDEGGKEASVLGIGHCHIDTAWLWPYHVTQQKTARSWSTQIDLMDRYPEHRFTCSSAQQYEWPENGPPLPAS
ncbi:hypothetical protein AURDEDRAFT_178681, partial [Auricularia subglabra TFB-10046 SS5]